VLRVADCAANACNTTLPDRPSGKAPPASLSHNSCGAFPPMGRTASLATSFLYQRRFAGRTGASGSIIPMPPARSIRHDGFPPRRGRGRIAVATGIAAREGS